MNEIVQLINTLGFPIAMVIYFIYDKNKTTANMLENVKESNAIVVEAINNNTKILTKFVEHFGADDVIKED